jgi:hypothetical protein
MTLSCEAVPDLHFEPADAHDEVGRDSGRQKDGAAEAEAEAEAEAQPGCPESAPDGAICCGKTPCEGDCSDAACEACEAKCGPETVDTVCCAKSAASHTCRPPSKACP